MKRLIIVNGTMGAGKSTLCEGLLKALPCAVYLDGDWCWRMDPFIVDEENKAMVLDHIVHLLRGFLTNSHFENVIFCWVIHQEAIFDSILAPLADLSFQLEKITLMLSPQQLRAHFARDAEAGLRRMEDAQASVDRLPLYEGMSTFKLWVDDMTQDQTLEAALRYLAGEPSY